MSSPPESTSQTLTAESAAGYASQRLYKCEYRYQQTRSSRRNEKVFCTKRTGSRYPSDVCKINIIFTCSSEYVVLTWDAAQNMNVLNFIEVQVIDCSKTNTTTTEVATTSTSTTSTSFTSSQQATYPSTTMFTDDGIHTTISIFESTSPAAGDTTINNTHLVNSNHLKEISDANSQISGQYIGIIVGAVVAAILITIAIMCIFWKLKTRREKNKRNEERESDTPASRNLEDMRVGRLRLAAKETDKKVSKTVARVSPLEREGHLTKVAADYTYIDVRTAASSKTNTALASPFPAVEELLQNSTTADAVTEIHNTEYSHLGTDKVRLENPYNGLEHEDSSTIIQPVILPVLHRENQPLKDSSRASHIRPTNHLISNGTEQSIGTNENNSVYSKLGESKGLPDNTYNLLHSGNNEPIKETRFKQHTGTSPNSETRTGIAPSSSETLQLFPHTSKYKNMDIVDVAPYKYAEIIPKTKQEKFNDINDLKEANHTVSLSASNSNHAISPTDKPDASTEIAVTKEVVKDNMKTPVSDEGSRQVYTNALYSMHDFSNEANTGVSLGDTTYAKIV